MSVSHIQWTNRVWNPTAGCDKVSDGCRFCYAIKQAWIRQHNPHPDVSAKYAGTVRKLENGTLNWTGTVNFSEKALFEPLDVKQPAHWFVDSMSDIFHRNITNDQRLAIFAVMAITPQHTYQVLTKRDVEMWMWMTTVDSYALRQAANRILLTAGLPVIHDLIEWPLKNVHMGVSTEDQENGNRRITNLLRTPAHKRWISAEPLLGPIDLTNIIQTTHRLKPTFNSLIPFNKSLTLGIDKIDGARINWVVTGGESGNKNSRPVYSSWIQQLRDQCSAHYIPFFFKQWGDWIPLSELPADFDTIKYKHHIKVEGLKRELYIKVGKKISGNKLQGRTHEQIL